MNATPKHDPIIPPAPHAKLLAELEHFEHLLFEPMTQADLDRLHALSQRWSEQFGDSPEAIALCDALEDFIGAGIEDGDVEQAYREPPDHHPIFPPSWCAHFHEGSWPSPMRVVRNGPSGFRQPAAISLVRQSMP